MKTYLFILLMGALVYPAASLSNTYEPDVGQHSDPPTCPPYSEKAHESLKRFVASSLPFTGDGIAIEAVSPSEIVWVAQHIRCEHMVHDPESEMYLTFWKSNQYYFIVARDRNPVRWIDENTLDVKLGTNSLQIFDLNLNFIVAFLL